MSVTRREWVEGSDSCGWRVYYRSRQDAEADIRYYGSSERIHESKKYPGEFYVFYAA